MTSDPASVHRAMELSHMFLGGRFTPIIPADDPDLAESLLDLFSPDVLWPASESNAVAELLARHSHLRWPSVHKELFLGNEKGPSAAQLLDVSHAILALEPKNEDERTMLAFDAVQPDWADDDPLASIFMAMFGKFSDPVHGPAYSEMFATFLSGGVARISISAPVHSTLARGIVPSVLTVHLLDQVQAPRGGTPGIFLGSASVSDDLIAFWNLRAAGIRMIFVDPSHLPRLQSFVMAWLDALPAQGLLPFEGRIGVWSRDRSAVVPEELGDRKWLRHGISEATWNGLNVRPGRQQFGRSSTLANADESESGVRLTFQAQPPIHTMNEPWARQQHAALTITTPRLSGRNDLATFYTPNIPALANYYSTNIPIIREEVRGDSGAISLLLPLWRHSPVTIQSTASDKTVAAVMASGGIIAAPSKAGRVARRILAQLGGIQATRVFMIAGVRDLLSRSNTGGIPRGAVQKAISQSISPHRRLFIRSRSTAELTEEEVLGYLTDKRILRLGAKVRCTTCELDSWLPLERFRAAVRCPLCDTRFHASQQFVRNTAWHYRASGLFGRADNQEGAIPVLLTLRALDTMLGSTSAEGAFATSMDVTIPGDQAGSQDREVDLVYMSAGQDGVTQVALGECKARGPIDERDLDGLTRIASLIGSSRVHPFLLFAKTTAFTDHELELLRPAAGNWPRRTILLGPDWLESYDFRLSTTEATSGRFLGHGMEELAELTHRRYFDAR